MRRYTITERYLLKPTPIPTSTTLVLQPRTPGKLLPPRVGFSKGPSFITVTVPSTPTNSQPRAALVPVSHADPPKSPLIAALSNNTLLSISIHLPSSYIPNPGHSFVFPSAAAATSHDSLAPSDSTRTRSITHNHSEIKDTRTIGAFIRIPFSLFSIVGCC